MRTPPARRSFQRARFDGGLFIPGYPSKRSVDLLLARDHVALISGSTRSQLEWDDFTADAPLLIPPTRDAAARPSRWRVEPWTPGPVGELAPVTNVHHPTAVALLGLGLLGMSILGRRLYAVGVGVTLEGDYIDSTHEVRSSKRSLVNRLGQMTSNRVRIPISAATLMNRAIGSDIEVLAILCEFLSQDINHRERLADRTAVERLIPHLATRRVDRLSPPVGTRRLTTETISALRHLGYVHHLGGRPLPGQQQETLADIVAQVVDRIRTNPHSSSIRIDENEVSSIVDRVYLSVAPWPFEALIED